MEQAASTRHSGEPNPLDTRGLCLLSLDGGGVRGLSTLYILKHIMDRLNHEREKESLPPVKPCEVFDLIGGTSTGGLIAIMLGRLQMTVDECIAAYSDLAAAVFSEKPRSLLVDTKWGVTSPFSTARLKSAVERVIVQSGATDTDLFNDGTEHGCRTFVCSIDRDTGETVHLRSYSLPNEPDFRATICEAALATFATSILFSPVRIEDQNFAAGNLRVNNPVDEVEGQAANIWCSVSGDLKSLLRLCISIGAGNPGEMEFEESMSKHQVVKIAMEAEENGISTRWANEKWHLRFNVQQGLQYIGLEEHKRKDAVEAASEEYLMHTAQRSHVQECIQNLRRQQSTAAMDELYLTDEDVQRKTRLDTHSRIEAPWIVPFQRNPHFLGRCTEISEVDVLLSSETHCARVALVGLGGIGKTQIALEYVHQLRERQPECSVFWITASNVERMLEVYLEIGRQLRIPNLEQEQADVQELVQHWLTQESSGRWLLVFDDADDIDVCPVEAAMKPRPGLRIDRLPESRYGSILFTTRTRKVAKELAGKNVILVDNMEKITAMNLLKKTLINRGAWSNDGVATDVLEKLLYHPLAIVQAAAYVDENGISLVDYGALLNGTDESIINVLSEEFEDEGRSKDEINSVVATWLSSFEQIRTRDPLAADYMSFMSCVDGNHIPLSLPPPAGSKKEAVDAIETLVAYSFVIEHGADQLLDLHPLVHVAVRNWLRMEGSLGKWELKALERLEEVFPGDNYIGSSATRIYLPHVRYALDSSGSKKTGLLWVLGKLARLDGRYKDAEEAFKQVMQVRKNTLGAENSDTLASMATLAETYIDQGRWKEAEELLLQVIEIRKRVLGAEHPDTLGSMDNLASTYWNHGRWKEAEELLKQVMETKKRLPGTERLNKPGSKTDMAATYRSQGQWNEEVAKSTMGMIKNTLGPQHPDTLASMATLAATYKEQGRWKEAGELLVQVTEIREKILGPEHSDTLGSMTNLTLIYWNQGRLKQAQELGVQVVETSKRVLGADHPSTLIRMANLAAAYRDQGLWKEADDLDTSIKDTISRQGYHSFNAHSDTEKSRAFSQASRSDDDHGSYREAPLDDISGKALVESSHQSSDAYTTRSPQNIRSSTRTEVSELAQETLEEERKQVMEQFTYAITENFTDFPPLSEVSLARLKEVFAKKLERFSTTVIRNASSRTIGHTRNRNAAKIICWHKFEIAEEVLRRAFLKIEQDRVPSLTQAPLANELIQEPPVKTSNWHDMPISESHRLETSYPEDPHDWTEETQSESPVEDIVLDASKNEKAPTIPQDDEDFRRYLENDKEFHTLVSELLRLAEHYCSDTMKIIQTNILKATGPFQVSR